MTRLDVWLDVACLCRTRSEAQRACKGGKVRVNDHRAKPHREVHEGDRIEITSPAGRRRQVVVDRLEETHVTRTAARELYTDVTPPPTAEQLAMRDLLRRAGPPPGRAPEAGRDRRGRREIRRLKTGGG